MSTVENHSGEPPDTTTTSGLPPRERQSPDRTGSLVAVILCAAFTTAATRLFFSDTLEDSFITFRYSQRLAEGYPLGFWNRTGPPVEGFTSLLWTMLLAGTTALSLPFEMTSKVLGLAFLLGTMAPFAILALFGPHRDLPKDGFVWGARIRLAMLCSLLLLGTSLRLAWYAATGMEATLFACLSAWAILGPWLRPSRLLASLVGVSLVLCRPEGIVVVLLAFALHGGEAILLRQTLRSALVPLAWSTATQVALVIFRLAYFGYPLPNTYYAKAHGASLHHLRLGLTYSWDFVLRNPALHGLLLTGCTFLVWKLIRLCRRAGGPRLDFLVPALLSCYLFCWYAYVTKVGGDNYWPFPHHRHFVHAAPALYLTAGVALVSLIRSTRWAITVVCVVSLIDNVCTAEAGKRNLMEVMTSAFQKFPTMDEGPDPYSLWFFPFRDSEVSIACEIGGRIPFFVDAYHIDMLGLNDVHIAHHGRYDSSSFVDSKSDMNYVFGLRPDIFASSLKASDVTRGAPRKKLIKRRTRMMVSTLDNAIFQNEYSFVENGPYDRKDRAVFARTDFCHAQPAWRCIPVKALQLGKKGSRRENGERR